MEENQFNIVFRTGSALVSRQKETFPMMYRIDFIEPLKSMIRMSYSFVILYPQSSKISPEFKDEGEDGYRHADNNIFDRASVIEEIAKKDEKTYGFFYKKLANHMSVTTNIFLNSGKKTIVIQRIITPESRFYKVSENHSADNNLNPPFLLELFFDNPFSRHIDNSRNETSVSKEPVFYYSIESLLDENYKSKLVAKIKELEKNGSEF